MVAKISVQLVIYFTESQYQLFLQKGWHSDFSGCNKLCFCQEHLHAWSWYSELRLYLNLYPLFSVHSLSLCVSRCLCTSTPPLRWREWISPWCDMPCCGEIQLSLNWASLHDSSWEDTSDAESQSNSLKSPHIPAGDPGASWSGLNRVWWMKWVEIRQFSHAYLSVRRLACLQVQLWENTFLAN